MLLTKVIWQRLTLLLKDGGLTADAPLAATGKLTSSLASTFRDTDDPREDQTSLLSSQVRIQASSGDSSSWSSEIDDLVELIEKVAAYRKTTPVTLNKTATLQLTAGKNNNNNSKTMSMTNSSTGSNLSGRERSRHFATLSLTELLDPHVVPQVRFDYTFLSHFLRHIDLHSSRISVIDEGLRDFENLLELNLMDNTIEVVEHLPANVTELTLACNKIHAVASLPAGGKLVYLNLSYNLLEHVSWMHTCAKELVSLVSLDLSCNHFTDLRALLQTIASRLPALRLLKLAGNPCCLLHGYRRMVLEHVPHLHALDDVVLSEAELAMSQTSDFDSIPSSVSLPFKVSISQIGNLHSLFPKPAVPEPVAPAAAPAPAAKGKAAKDAPPPPPPEPTMPVESLRLTFRLCKSKHTDLHSIEFNTSQATATQFTPISFDQEITALFYDDLRMRPQCVLQLWHVAADSGLMKLIGEAFVKLDDFVDMKKDPREIVFSASVSIADAWKEVVPSIDVTIQGSIAQA
jgi:hypothetical protein